MVKTYTASARPLLETRGGRRGGSNNGDDESEEEGKNGKARHDEERVRRTARNDRWCVSSVQQNRVLDVATVGGVDETRKRIRDETGVFIYVQCGALAASSIPAQTQAKSHNCPEHMTSKFHRPMSKHRRYLLTGGA